VELDPRRTIIIGILVLLLGKYLNGRFPLLRRFSIPQPVTGGLVASLLFALLHLVGIDLSFSNHFRDALLVVFFTAIGLSTEFSSIIRGGRILFLLSILAVAYLFLQNYVGVLMALLFGQNPHMGILAGAASLQGGHGNVVAWAPILEHQYGVRHAMEIGMTSATFGLIFGGILGGPVSSRLIDRYRLDPSDDEEITVGVKEGSHLSIDVDSMLIVLLMIALSVGLGIYLHDWAAQLGFTLPLFVTCMFSGVLLSNVLPLAIPRLKCPHGSPTLAIVSDLSLGLFLAMAMMGLRFWEIGDRALFIFSTLFVQVLILLVFAVFVVFRALGRNYDAAVITAGYIGSSLGATPTAMANMAAVTQRYGPSPMAFMVIPIAAAFILQLSNAVVIQIILNLMKG